MLQKIVLHPILYLIIATGSFATATLPFTPSGFFVITGLGFLGIMAWRIFMIIVEMEKEETKRCNR